MRIAAAALVFLVAAPAAAAEDPPEIFQKARQVIASGFRQAFIDECLEGERFIPQKTAFCECCADEVMRRMTLEELRDASYAQEFIEKNVVPGCREKVFGS